MQRLILFKIPTLYMYLVIACQDGDVRLSGGRNYREGSVEVCRSQQWGAVCDDEWDENDSAVVCRQLGHSGEGIIATNIIYVPCREQEA